MDIRPIHTDAEYEAALAEIERLFDAAPNTPEGDRLEVFATLVEAYEEQHYSIPAPEPIEAIKYHMESRGLCRRDLEPYLGSRARVAEVLNRKRPLSLEMIRRLHTGLGIAAEILIQPYPLATSAPNKGCSRRREAGAERRLRRADASVCTVHAVMLGGESLPSRCPWSRRTREAQGRHREVGAEGSVERTCGARDTNRIQGVAPSGRAGTHP